MLTTSTVHEPALQEGRQPTKNFVEEVTKVSKDDSVSDEDETDSADPTWGPQRSVQFSLVIRRYEIMSLDSYTEKECKKCWYSEEEKQKMFANKDKMVARLEKGKPLKRDLTYRGLECWTEEGGQSLDDNIARVLSIVMDEQDRQWLENKDDFDRIAELSAKVTGESAGRAREIALEDEKEAELVWQDMQTVRSSLAEEETSCTILSSTSNLYAKLLAEAKNGSSAMESTPSDISESSGNDPSPIRVEKSKKAKKSKKLTRKPRDDPPAPVERTASNKASDLLAKMRLASRQGTKVRSV